MSQIINLIDKMIGEGIGCIIELCFLLGYEISGKANVVENKKN